MIVLDAKDCCQNCGYFNPETEKLWIGDKSMTIIRCVDSVKCEGIYNSIKKKAGGEKNGRVG